MSESKVGKTLVKGHTLRQEGAAYVEESAGTRRGGWVGFGLCSCGARSEVLDGNNKRKRWHREHKAAMSS